MTTLQGDYTYADLERLNGILQAHDDGGDIFLQDDDVALLHRLFLSFVIAIPKPKMEEPTENYTVVNGVVNGWTLRFVRDDQVLGTTRWLCLDNRQRYAWSQINNPEVIK